MSVGRLGFFRTLLGGRPMPAPAVPERSSTAPSAFWPAVATGAVLAAAKAAHWGTPAPTAQGIRDFLRDWAAGAHQDVAFAALLGILGQLVLRLLARRPRLRELAWRGFVGLCLLCAAFAVASVQIFAYLRAPLTYSLLYLAGDMGAIRSSLGSFVTAPLLAAGAAALLAVLLAARAARRPRRTGPARPGVARAALAAAVLALLAYGHRTAEGRWRDRDDHLIVGSPHWVLLESYAVELLGGRSQKLDVAFGPEELADFQAAGPAPPDAPGERRPAGPAPRNLVVVVLESTGARYLSLYGSRYDTTPNLVAEAAHALVFDAFYCHVGLSANSLAALSLSIYPYMTWREYTVEYPDYPGVTLAELFRAGGARTAFLESADLDYVGQGRFLRGRGYDVLWDLDELGGRRISSWGGEDRVLVDGLLRWIDQEPRRPFYAVVWTAQSHHPYEPLPERPFVEFFREGPLPPDDYDLGRYLNTLREADRQLGRLFAGLRERGLADDTLVVITGDHGEAFGDPHPTWGHGARVYEENVRVPLMLWSPRLFPRGRRSAVIGSHVDVNPTLADLAGLRPAPSWEGRSLFEAGRRPRAYFYAANDDYLLGVREGEWKYIYNATRGRDELYHLASDPDERHNRAAERPEDCRRLRRRLAAWRDHAGRQLGAAGQRRAAAAR